jgi:hypothetical protein
MIIWTDYNIEHRPGYGFTVKGEWDGEVMGWTEQGEKDGGKRTPLYKPGELYKVDENGWLVKLEHWM